MLLLKEFYLLTCVLTLVCAKPNIQSRIIGGSATTSSAFKHQVALRWTPIPPLRAGTLFCGGSIISGRFVLTAGHCLCKDAASLGVPDLPVPVPVPVVEPLLYVSF